ncbi:ATP-grasp fold amidoligase family protein [uncultured Gimesia sp.]|uniref:ATP-grasp fold amidoligase family protein n=1 Tax=uncultured Gimesia sp. TaxID=1678688 RepID=UPI0030D9D87F|tara:strand:- start:94672 stop:97692 length:3021 start_codon:yes stop_codon:yes gene_type:complete
MKAENLTIEIVIPDGPSLENADATMDCYSEQNQSKTVVELLETIACLTEARDVVLRNSAQPIVSELSEVIPQEPLRKKQFQLRLRLNAHTFTQDEYLTELLEQTGCQVEFYLQDTLPDFQFKYRQIKKLIERWERSYNLQASVQVLDNALDQADAANQLSIKLFPGMNGHSAMKQMAKSNYLQFLNGQLSHTSQRTSLGSVKRMGNRHQNSSSRANLSPLSNNQSRCPDQKPKIAVLVAVFDPTGSSNLFKNYKRFRDELTPDADVFVAEASYTGRFHIQDATIKVNATHRQVLWQKERLFNLLLDQLPPEYDCVMWADADIIFENKNWLRETVSLLESHDVVFPYSTATRLGADGKPERKQRVVALVDQEGTQPGAPDWHRDRGQGLAWTFRREWLERHRFDDYCMNGSGDSHDYYAIKGDPKWGERHCSKETYPLWLERCKAIRGSKVTYASGHLIHLYHGSKTNRQYKPLEDLLKQINFDPTRDIQIAKNGLWEWRGKESAYNVIRDSFYKRQMEAGQNKRYSTFLKDGSIKPTWNSPLGEVIMSKHTSKEFARSLNLPSLRTPQTYKLKSNSILKPDRDCGGRRVRVIQKNEDWIYEELIPHDKDYRLFAFGGRVVMLQIDICKETPNGMQITEYNYKRYPDWKTLDLDKSLTENPSLIFEAEPPVCLPEMVATAEEISYHFPVPVRVDFFIDDQGHPVYNEMSITPGLVKDGRITDEGDLWLGSFLNEPLLNLRQAYEPEYGPIPLPDDTGILTSSDDTFFPAFQLLFVSVMARYKTKFAVADLGLTARQRSWCEHQPDITLIDLPETLPVPRSAEVWQNWNKPLYFQLSPFKRNLWIDSDCVVMGGLEVMASKLQDQFYTCECVAPFRREDRMTFPHKLFGTNPVNDTLVMAGICGFDRERDAEFIANWLAKCVELEKAPRKKRVMRDQEALQWMVDVNGHHDRILRGSKWNECNVKYSSAGPREFLSSLSKEQANIYHFYGKSKGSPPFWSTWGEVPIW